MPLRCFPALAGLGRWLQALITMTLIVVGQTLPPDPMSTGDLGAGAGMAQRIWLIEFVTRTACHQAYKGNQKQTASSHRSLTYPHSPCTAIRQPGTTGSASTVSPKSSSHTISVSVAKSTMNIAYILILRRYPATTPYGVWEARFIQNSSNPFTFVTIAGYAFFETSMR
jgi:hypothetical protein